MSSTWSAPTADSCFALRVEAVASRLAQTEAGMWVLMEWERPPHEGWAKPRNAGRPVGGLRCWVTREQDAFRLELRRRDGSRCEQFVRFAYSKQHFGGRRSWFECPGLDGQRCGRRVGMLWLGREFACRGCHGLVYESQREDAIDRAHRRSAMARLRLGAAPCEAHFMGRIPERPPRMRRRTYVRMCEKVREADRAAWDVAVRSAGFATSEDLTRALRGDKDAPRPSTAIRWGKA